MNAWDVIKSALLQAIGSVLRTLLIAGMAWLTTRRYITSETATQVVALVPTVLAALIWSFIEKYILVKLHMKELLTALMLPENSSLDDLKRATGKTKELPNEIIE